jgi:hypothetical protein
LSDVIAKSAGAWLRTVDWPGNDRSNHRCCN